MKLHNIPPTFYARILLAVFSLPLPYPSIETHSSVSFDTHLCYLAKGFTQS